MSDRVALVTGAQAGIGAACAQRLAKDGIAIGVLDLEARFCENTLSAVQATGARGIAIGADISDREQVKAALARVRKELGPITILVNNAAITGYVPFLEMTDAQWESVHKVNLTGTFIVTQEVLPDMVTANWGRIISIASSAAQTGAKHMAHYASSKGGMIALSRSLAVEFGPNNITANVIPPRFITGTIMSDHSFANSRQPMNKEGLIAAGPIRREGRPEDIAGAVAWLASEESGYVTGQVIGINGGRIIS